MKNAAHREMSGVFLCRSNQKIAACGSSYKETHSNVGAAAGCDLLIFTYQALSE
ncbi:hypothetical protein KW849_06510 [Pseudomonas sp. PDM26]|uniref:hypothetical protein n=1 Tax=Pseudomonas sp. PDM26 TaxID=2854766 RepID=UPI001C44294C|nr:hypothetical protein [Pseudomonas sp. PDM26]MBV7545955.1 hypothetical protein [Pseudomonas sp. PDM26]